MTTACRSELYDSKKGWPPGLSLQVGGLQGLGTVWIFVMNRKCRRNVVPLGFPYVMKLAF